MKKRIFGIVLGLMLAVGMLPNMVFAQAPSNILEITGFGVGETVGGLGVKWDDQSITLDWYSVYSSEEDFNNKTHKMTGREVFEENEDYYIAINVNESGIEESSAYCIDGEVISTSEHEDGTLVNVKLNTTYSPNKQMAQGDIHIEGITKPVPGQMPTTEGVTIDNNNYRIVDAFWLVYDETAGGYTPIIERDVRVDDVPFEEGKLYRLALNIVPLRIYDGNPDVKVTVGTKELPTITQESMAEYVHKSFKIIDDSEDGFVITAVINPDDTIVPIDPDDEDDNNGESDDNNGGNTDNNGEDMISGDDDASKEDTDKAAKTGDDSNLMLWTILMIMAAITGTGTVLCRRKNTVK